MKALTIGIVVDFLTSLVATCLFAAFVFYSFTWRGMGTLFAAAGLVFISAGFLRGNSAPRHSWLKSLLLASTFVVYLYFNPIQRLMLGIQIAIAYGSSFAGVCARRAWKVGTRDRSLAILGVVLGLVEMLSLLGAPVLAERMTTRTVDVPMPEIGAVGLDGRAIDSSDFKGRVTVLYFWATWCPVCWEEFPKLEKLYERYEANPKVAFLVINVGGPDNTPETAKSFIEAGGYRIPAAFDSRHIAARLTIRVYPFLLVLDKSWHARLAHSGYDGSERYVENLSREIDKLLAEPQSSPSEWPGQDTPQGAKGL